MGEDATTSLACLTRVGEEREGIIVPDGQITPMPACVRCQSVCVKYSDFQKWQISCICFPSHPDRGALANVINVGRAAVAAEGASDGGA